MTLPPLPLQGGALFIDNSHWIELMMTCDRYLEYTSLRNRVSAEEKSALNFGTSIHDVEEYRFKIWRNEKPGDGHLDDISSILSTFFDAHPVPEDDYRNLNWAFTMAKRLVQKYEIEPFSLLEYNEAETCTRCKGTGQGLIGPCLFCSGTGKNKLMVEMPFAIHLYDHNPKGWIGYDGLPEGRCIPVFYTGRIDLPLILDGQVWILDHKTNKEMGSWFWDDQRRSSQQRGYVWAFQELTKQPVAGYIVNGIRTKEPPKYVVEGTSFKGKTKTIEEWWNESLQRERFYTTADQIAEWKQNTIELVERFFWHYSRGYMPINTKSCTRYGRCPYWEVCTTERSSRGVMLASNLFTDNKWSPLIKTQT